MSETILKITDIRMEWTDSGAVVFASVPIGCPRCGIECPAAIEHRCGDKLPGSDRKKPKRRLKGASPKAKAGKHG